MLTGHLIWSPPEAGILPQHLCLAISRDGGFRPEALSGTGRKLCVMYRTERACLGSATAPASALLSHRELEFLQLLENSLTFPPKSFIAKISSFHFAGDG